MEHCHVTIVGGGIIGLSIAVSVASLGKQVTLIDSGASGQASRAAAGMLAPLAESSEYNPLLPLAVESLQDWPVFAARLAEFASSNDLIHATGIIRVALTDNEADRLRATYLWQSEIGLLLDELSTQNIHALEPSLSSDIQYAVHSPDERSVDPAVVIRALRQASISLGVNLVENTEILAIETSGTSVVCVRSTSESFIADNYLICGGAWSANLLASIGYALPVTPIKGQIARLGPSAESHLSHIIYSHSGYLVPRPEGYLLAGATVERVGFNGALTQEGINSQYLMSQQLAPNNRGRAICGGTAGLRPVSADGCPIVDRVPGWENLMVAAGHGRNGILLAPLTGKIVANFLTDSSKNPLPAAFSADRFTTPAP